MLSFLSVLLILLLLLSLLLGSNRNDGAGGGAVLAFTTVRRHNVIIPTAPSSQVTAQRSSSSSSSSTLLFYMTDGSADESTDAAAAAATNSNNNKEVVPINPSKSLKKKLKKLKKKITVSSRTHQLYKRGMQAASEEELATHVQADFHAGFLDFDTNDLDNIDEEDDTCDEEDGQCVEPYIVSDPEEGELKPPTAAAAESSKAAINTIAMLDRHPALVLNADYQPLRMLPLSIWSWQDTVKAVLGGKAIVVDIYPDVYIRAVNINMPVPSVIALRDYAPTGKARPAFTRRNVFLRDGYRCQYCLCLFRTSDLSLDHVEPRCLGGRLTWENAATCCKRCNGRKGSLRPTELYRVGMELKSKPRCPTLFELAAEAQKFVPRRVHPTWAPYLGISSKSAVVLGNRGSSVEESGNSSNGGTTRMKKMKKYRPYE